MEQEIIQEYLNGKSISALSKIYPLSYRKIQQLLVNNNITIRGGRKKKTLTDSQLKELEQDFYNGVIYDELSKKYSLDKETLRNIIKEKKFVRRNNNRINKRILSDYFSLIDKPEKAYWLGFLYTDGCVDHYRSTGRIRLQVQEQDIDILEQLKKDLCLDCQIIYDVRPNSTCCSVEFTDEQIFNDLSKYGIIPNKTYESKYLPYQNIPKEYLTAYLLGVYDGDGGLSYSKDFSKDVTLSFATYYEQTAKDFQSLIDQLIDKQNSNKVFYTSAWHCAWRGRIQVLNILDKLYESCPIHLNRKYELYKKLKNSLS